MALKKIVFKITRENEKQRLDHVLAEELPRILNQPISKGKVRKLVIAGAVYLNKKRVRIASKELHFGAQVEVYVDLKKLNSDAPSKDLPFEMTQERVLFEDEDLIIVNKPPGLPTQPTLDEARVNLFASVKKFLAVRAGVSVSDVYLGLHHRLDRDTSGVILFTKSTEANPGIATQFSSHLLKKMYQAIVISNRNKEILETWSVKNFLGKSKDVGKVARFCSVRSGGLHAHTDFRLLKRFEGAALVQASPHTGRSHQIRVHLSEEGLPIFGDPVYGGSSQVGEVKASRVMLHAASLTFTHPIHNNEIIVESSLPEDFSRCIEALQRGCSGF